jgi:hypothetical protein
MNIRKALATVAAFFLFTLAFAAQAQDNVLNLTNRKIPVTWDFPIFTKKTAGLLPKPM